MLPERVHLEAATRENPFLKKKQGITYAESELGDWLVEHISPSDLGEKYIVVLQTTHTHIHVAQNALKALAGEPNKPSDLEKDFNERADRWERQTAIYSNPSSLYLHRDYYAITGRGIENPRLVIPWILKRLESHGGDWFFALEKITDENPAKNCEDFDSAKSAWNEWAKERGIISKANALQTA